MTNTRTEIVEFNGNGSKTQGYLARPEGDGPFPGVIVIQEWWGLNDNIKDIANRFAKEGFVAFAPDLYDGTVTPEPDEAQKLMMQLDMNRASQRPRAEPPSISRSSPTSGSIGATGFCMGGGLALTLACDTPLIKAVAPFYGGNPQPIDAFRTSRAPSFGTYAAHDGWVAPDVVARGSRKRSTSMARSSSTSRSTRAPSTASSTTRALMSTMRTLRPTHGSA